jgi:NADPH-dependent glutamate synthase beta subunit-like oxidoreductase/NAD(P)H-flavin reductase
MSDLKLSYNLQFQDLYSHDGLSKVDAAFAEHLKAANVELYNKFLAARTTRPEEKKDESNLLIEIAPVLEDFIAELFNIREQVSKLQFAHNELGDLFTAKRLFVQRAAAKFSKAADTVNYDYEKGEAELAALFGEPFSEQAYAKNVVKWMDANDVEKQTIAAHYANWASSTDEGKHHTKDGVIFKKPKKLDFANLVPMESEIVDGVTILKLPKHEWRHRDGFKLTDNGGDLTYALDQANYCIYCHNQGKDSCSKGLWEKDGKVRKSPTAVNLAGCPLEEKISEMNTVKASGFTIGALGIITIDNPMCAATGHRICNDCMKSCIYQKQSPVDIPQVETRSLKDVLSLPYGFEIYSLLTRWNPLNLDRPLPRKETGYKVLVAGLGPAGFTLAHHLMNDGHEVVGIDGLKIEPINAEISGVDAFGKRHAFKPIRDIKEIYESLDERVLAGFGGVAEYGITVRWDKNFLKIIRLLLERRSQFSLIGGVRFGSNITYDQAFEMGFDHIALCMGAGKPTVVEMKNALARGVRTASDFLMALQLTGAAKKDSIANLAIRLPVVVIGGGLTAVDSATESMAYYPIQIEKFLTRVEAIGEAAYFSKLTEEEKEIATEWLTHARELRANPGKEQELLNKWGGVYLVYRKTIQDAPSYRLNHEEVELAFQEAINFIGNATPTEVILDKFGHANGMKAVIDGVEHTIPARTILMAAGTSPNTVAAREDSEHFELDGKYFRMIDEDGNVAKPEWISKPSKSNVLMSVNAAGKAVSFFGDLHPDYAGNVVKAMGSAKQGYPVVSRVLKKAAPKNINTDFNSLLRAQVHDVVRLTPNIIEVIVKAPLAARNFQPGQFYRLQNFEAFATKLPNTTLAMEGLALTGAWVDKEKGLMSTIVLEMGGSSDLCSHLKKGEPVVLMGPTGTPTDIPKNETVMLIGGGLGNAVLFSIGKAMRENGCKVLYFAGYKKPQDRYKIDEIEAASDVVIWACDEHADFAPNRPNDRFFTGNIVQAIEAYATGKLGETTIKTQDIQHLVVIGSDRMMAAIAFARHNQLKEYLPKAHVAIGSINSPMQCMMKEICAQCLQRHVDPETGAESYVYSCFNQDQLLDCVDFNHLNQRLKQNTTQEKLTAMWIDKSLKEIGSRETKAA